MATSNTKTQRAPVKTHQGGRASRNHTALQELRRSTLTALLFENQFYENGSAHAKRVAELVDQCEPADVATLAIEARETMHLRHMPLFLVRELARKAKERNSGSIVSATLSRVIQRADEIAEYLAMYWADRKAGARRLKGQAPISAASKRGLAAAFGKFDRYALSKYRGDGKSVSLRDALRLVQPTPKDDAQKALWKDVLDQKLAQFDTWENELSAGKDKKAVFERLLSEKKLGGMAFLRNLRNMVDAGVDKSLLRARFRDRDGFKRILPFRFLAAARYAPSLVSEISDAMLMAVEGHEKLQGTTFVLVDVSGSMDHPLSAKSEMTRIDAAAGLAVYLREICDDVRVFAYSEQMAEVKNYRGLALAEGINQAVPHRGTYTGAAIHELNKSKHDRIIVVTDEQAGDNVGMSVATYPYIINVAPYQYGVGYGRWVSINGWSDRVVDFIRAHEAQSKD